MWYLYVFAGPLIYERDLYLAWTLKRSRAVCGQRRVVGVVGRGHLAGVMRAVEADQGGDTLVRDTPSVFNLKSAAFFSCLLPHPGRHVRQTADCR